MAPGLTQPSVNLLLSEPDEYTLKRSNQLDIAFSRDFTVGGMRVRPQVDLFNALNAQPGHQRDYGVRTGAAQPAGNPRPGG